MPNIIQQLRDTYSENPAAALKMLPELFKQYDNGLISILPCKIGDTVYINDGYWDNCCKGYVANIAANMFNHCLRFKYTVGFMSTLIDKEFIRDFYSEDIGNTVFLTREAAEKALEDKK